ncbi:MAG: trypsin-like peptidase domain-containing protein [Lachnospiraceae bacterium]|nr:trypsin-like peptidase domain-containing protein [Lachnospiraceae bacterium]
MYQDNNYNNSGNYNGGNYSSEYQAYEYDRSGEQDRRSYGYDYESDNKKSGRVLKTVVGTLLVVALVGTGTYAGFRVGNSAVRVPELQTAAEQQVLPEIAETVLPEKQQPVTQQPETVRTVITDVTNVVEAVMPSVVSITNTSIVTQSFWGQQFTSENASSGSGFIVGENENELLIVTNNHVITDSTELKVQFIDESVATAKIKGADSNMDLAVLAVPLEQLEQKTREVISIAVLGDSESLKVGEPAIAIGNALGYGQSVTTGVISALNRQIMVEDGTTVGSLIQTDAAINPGNSGGALLNVNGEVVGINSNKMGGNAIEGMGYAIPISKAKPIIEELMSRETRDKVAQERKGYLGISGLDVTSEVSKMYGMPLGVYVAQVYEGGAAKAGMLKGDIITAFDGNTVTTMEELQEYLEYYEIGSTVLVTIERPTAGGYIEQTLLVSLGEQVQTP